MLQKRLFPKASAVMLPVMSSIATVGDSCQVSRAWQLA